MSFAAAMLVALAIDAAIGWPDRLYARIGHPVTWIGALIHRLDLSLNHGDGPRRWRAGVLALAVVLGLVGGLSIAVQIVIPTGWVGILILGALAWPLVALRSMHTHVEAVAVPLSRRDLPAARKALAMIVGRDPSQLETSGIARAGLESLAENTSDGIVAPVVWGVVAGLPGIAIYKAINTADSMIGHRTARYRDFGWAAARLDDLVNWIPARLTAGLFALASGRLGAAWSVVRADARRHRSPNAGWPEAAMAGALHLRLSGPRIYDGVLSDEPFVNPAAPDPDAEDLARGLALYRRTMLALAAVLLALAVI
jgi:adenosylcobinamide-phosphate synthase